MDVFFSLRTTCYECGKVNPTATDQQMWSRWRANECKAPWGPLTKLKIAHPCTESGNTDRSPIQLTPFHGEAGKVHEEKVMATVAWN